VKRGGPKQWAPCRSMTFVHAMSSLFDCLVSCCKPNVIFQCCHNIEKYVRVPLIIFKHSASFPFSLGVPAAFAALLVAERDGIYDLCIVHDGLSCSAHLNCHR